MRTFIKLSLVAGLAVLAAGCATPESTTQDLAENGTAQPVRECRWAKATGTKMRSRICHSQEIWARLDAATAEAQDTDDFFRRQRENAAAAGPIEVPVTGGASL